MDETQQRRIAQGLRDGQPDAWRDFYDAFAERVWRSVARLLGPSSADVADVVQETFLAAAKSARGYDPEKGSLWFWLCGITRRHLALHFRKQERHQRLQLARAWLVASNGKLQSSPHEVLETGEVAELVRATLAELPIEYEDVLTAKYLDGVSVEQLAGRDCCSETAVRSRLARARTAFRAAFAKHTEIPAGGSS
ncbi:MAG: RNA polymerase sigma factor [Gemmataceae bacterium]